MFTYSCSIRVRYGETDQMGVVYYGNYASYLEVARVEALRSIGIEYKAMEEEGVIMPVLEYKTKFIKPALYDDLLRIELIVKSIPSTRIVFDYELFNPENELINIATTTLVFIDKQSKRPIKMTGAVEKALMPFFKNA